jgi:hypothetical protein
MCLNHFYNKQTKNRSIMANSQKVRDAKRAYAEKMTAEYAKKGQPGAVIVMPEFMEDEDGSVHQLPEDFVTARGDKGFGYMQLYSATTEFQKGVQYDVVRACLQRGRATSLQTQYKAGMNIGGKIVSEDTLTPPNAANPLQDLKFGSEALRTAGIPMKVGDKPIYNIRYWEPTGTAHDIRIEHTNQLELEAFTAQSGKANTGAIQNAAVNMLAGKNSTPPADDVDVEELNEELEELKAIPVAQRNAAQKARIKDIKAILETVGA